MESVVQATSAAVGGFISCTALFPMEVTKNVLANQKQGDDEGVIETMRGILARDGVGGFFRGVVFAASQSATEKATYFFANTWLTQLYAQQLGLGEPTTVPALILGYLSEWCHLSFTMPMDLVQKKITLDETGASLRQIVGRLYEEQGVAGFYAASGCYVVLAFKPAIQYVCFDFMKTLLLRRRAAAAAARAPAAQVLTALQAFVLGAIARAVATVAVYPYIRANVLLSSGQAWAVLGEAEAEAKAESEAEAAAGGDDQTKERLAIAATGSTLPAEVAKRRRRRPAGIVAVVWALLSKGGLFSLYSGVGVTLGRGVLSAALMLMIKEKIAVVVRIVLTALLARMRPGRPGRIA